MPTTVSTSNQTSPKKSPKNAPTTTPKTRAATSRKTPVTPVKSAVVVVAEKKPQSSTKETGSSGSSVQSKLHEAKDKAKAMLEGRGGLIASAVGAATAAAAGIAAFKTLSGTSRKVFHLMPHEEGWQVTRPDKKKPELVRATKRDARAEARSLAHGNEPSQLVIHREDGTIQTVHTYGE